jgi:UrcA family protein
MNTDTSSLNARTLSCIAASAACAVLSWPLQATDRDVIVKVSVSTAGLDLSQPAGARELYSRLQKAAHIVCSSSGRVALQPVTDFATCREKALGDAVRSVNRPQLAIAYLRTHTLQEAAAHGIDVPVFVAAK